MSKRPQSPSEAHASMPEFRRPQRARLWLDMGSREQWLTGWGQIDGPWLHWLDDKDNRWVTWPVQHVSQIEWTPMRDSRSAA